MSQTIAKISFNQPDSERNSTKNVMLMTTWYKNIFHDPVLELKNVGVLGACAVNRMR
jgi:hypothetical protein